MGRKAIVDVPDVRGLREAESENVGADTEYNGDAETDSEHGKPKRENVHFYGIPNLFDVLGITLQHHSSNEASDAGFFVSNQRKFHKIITH